MVWDIANTEHFAGIPMKPLLDDSDVNIDDVAGFQDFPVTRNTMTDHMVDGGAYRFGKTVVVERRRNGSLVVNDVIMAQSVQFAGADSGLYMGSDHLQHFSGQSAGNTHLFDFVWVLDVDAHDRR